VKGIGRIENKTQPFTKKAQNGLALSGVADLFKDFHQFGHIGHLAQRKLPETKDSK